MSDSENGQNKKVGSKLKGIEGRDNEKFTSCEERDADVIGHYIVLLYGDVGSPVHIRVLAGGAHFTIRQTTDRLHVFTVRHVNSDSLEIGERLHEQFSVG